MTFSHKKDKVALAYDANLKRLRNEARLVMDALLNEALAEMTEQFQAALNKGDILSIEGSRDEMRRFLRLAADRELGKEPRRALSK